MHAWTQAEVVGIVLADGGRRDLKIRVVDVSPESFPIVIVGEAGLACGKPLLRCLSTGIVGIETKGPVEARPVEQAVHYPKSGPAETSPLS